MPVLPGTCFEVGLGHRRDGLLSGGRCVRGNYARATREVAQIQPNPARAEGDRGSLDPCPVGWLAVVGARELAQPFAQLTKLVQPAFLSSLAPTVRPGSDPVGDPVIGSPVSQGVVPVGQVTAVEKRHDAVRVALHQTRVHVTSIMA